MSDGAQNESMSPSVASQIVHEVALARIRHQAEAMDAIDRKIGLSLSVSGFVVALFSGSFVFRTAGMSTGEWAAVVLVGLLFFAACWCGIQAYWITDWNESPGLKSLRRTAKNHSLEEMMESIADEVEKSIDDNNAIMGKRANLSNLAFLFSILSFLTIVASVLAIHFPFCQ
ncbi:MAG: hypothetical protein F4X58_02310 [Chloroflexi bacterium]|nr:hypothetical protein [Chloroflexota bacterium]MYC00738.1 hypothetical protein [Chloroflexota bacterium]